MINIMKIRWNKNRETLRKVLSERTDLNTIEYKELVKLTFDVIFNECNHESNRYAIRTHDQPLNLNAITKIDDGDYQGTLLFLIPFDTYQPGENEYLMTYIGYGSCSGCDVLQGLQSFSANEKLDENQINGFMSLCKDIISNTIRPYNHGWREDELYLPAEE